MRIPCDLLPSLTSKQKVVYIHLCHNFFWCSNCTAAGQLSMAIAVQHERAGEFRAKSALKCPLISHCGYLSESA